MNSSSFTHDGKYCMLALDQRGSFRKMINPTEPQTVQVEVASQLKGEIIAALYEKFSGLLIDFDYGLPAYKKLTEYNKPFLLPAEKTGYTAQQGFRLTEIENTAENITNTGASGVKLLVYYNPDTAVSDEQIEIAKTVSDQAKRLEIPFFLEPLNYNTSPQVARTVKDFVEAEVRPDVFKLEYPGNLEECQKVSHFLGVTPWILLTKGVDFDDFVPLLETAVAGGCSGFLAGRALWKEYLQLTEQSEKEKFLTETLPSRFEIITQIAKG
jgi:tagatose 1,6-diphosphate aldolase